MKPATENISLGPESNITYSCDMGKYGGYDMNNLFNKPICIMSIGEYANMTCKTGNYIGPYMEQPASTDGFRQTYCKEFVI
jgi:hypothetical protein